ncbi:starvation-inducible DNA-binding protein [Georgenia satyanarayanai]|uniref:Starvation-inducible DNA-binding protein n=1 Tax=Georgenia satyanarayanai TaxID=860221 RepID=A0A2Y8ZWC5_9MICO|nr:DNA starvation/stationary phase protection protein [Georgenia satyanarayanai]PYG01584.1 starvation-inducible DNA-binding protein [Georgenia satyanarayanai]SSA36384.1 starvation-inducible DNA-binding protein [Georgenia satyanarayanai]
MAAKPTEKVLTSLQETLVDLIDLSLQAKQAHWNIYGSHFRSVHLQLDEVTAEVRLASDDVAERLVAIGGEPDGRASTVASSTRVESLSGGRLPDDKVIRQFEERLQSVADRIKSTLDDVEESDPLSHDLLVTVATGLEKQAWMFRAASGDAG